MATAEEIETRRLELGQLYEGARRQVVAQLQVELLRPVRDDKKILRIGGGLMGIIGVQVALAALEVDDDG